MKKWLLITLLFATAVSLEGGKAKKTPKQKIKKLEKENLEKEIEEKLKNDGINPGFYKEFNKLISHLSRMPINIDLIKITLKQEKNDFIFHQEFPFEQSLSLVHKILLRILPHEVKTNLYILDPNYASNPYKAFEVYKLDIDGIEKNEDRPKVRDFLIKMAKKYYEEIPEKLNMLIKEQIENNGKKHSAFSGKLKDLLISARKICNLPKLFYSILKNDNETKENDLYPFLNTLTTIYNILLRKFKDDSEALEQLKPNENYIKLDRYLEIPELLNKFIEHQEKPKDLIDLSSFGEETSSGKEEED